MKNYIRPHLGISAREEEIGTGLVTRTHARRVGVETNSQISRGFIRLIDNTLYETTRERQSKRLTRSSQQVTTTQPWKLEVHVSGLGRNGTFTAKH